MKASESLQNDESAATENALRRAVDTTPAFIHTAWPDGYLDYFNRGWLDFLGKSLEDVCGWRWTESVHPEDVAALVQKWRAALASGEPFESFYAMAGCYNGDPEVKEGHRHGVDFTFRPPFVIGEIAYRWNYRKNAPALPGNLKLGAYYNGGSANVFDSGLAGKPIETVHGRYGLYALADQALARWGDPGEKRHLGAFASFVAAPDQRINQMPYFFDAGLVAYGFLPSRPRDQQRPTWRRGDPSRD